MVLTMNDLAKIDYYLMLQDALHDNTKRNRDNIRILRNKINKVLESVEFKVNE